MRMASRTTAVIASLMYLTAFVDAPARAQQPALPPDSFFDANGIGIR